MLLLDEIEKASPYLLNLFLQAFDEGWITDGRGKKVYLSDAIIIMTSNLGSDNFKKYMKPLGFGKKTLADVKQINREVIKAAEDRFSPEFRNRIDEIVVFSPLTQDEVKQIAELYLGKLKRQMKRQGKQLEVSESARRSSGRERIQPGIRRALPQAHDRRDGEAAGDHQVERSR